VDVPIIGRRTVLAKLKNQQGHVQQKGQTGLSCGTGQTHRNGSQSKNWLAFHCPGPCDSKMKEVDGKKVYWCGMCKHWNTTHTMEAHVRGAGGKKPSQGSSAQANLGFVNDPSAWIMDIGDTKDLIYCLSIKVSLLIFCDDIGFCYCPCCISGIHTHVEQLSLVRCPIVTFLDSIVNELGTFLLASPVWYYNLSWTSETS
jgi:hypothetical protein